MTRHIRADRPLTLALQAHRRTAVDASIRRIGPNDGNDHELCVPLLEMTSQWCKSRSRMAEARTSSPNTWPHSLKDSFARPDIRPSPGGPGIGLTCAAGKSSGSALLQTSVALSDDFGKRARADHHCRCIEGRLPRPRPTRARGRPAEPTTGLLQREDRPDDRSLRRRLGDCRITCVRGGVAPGCLFDGEPVAVVDGELVQDAFPTVDPSCRVRSVRDLAGGDKVEHFHRCLLGGEMPSVADRPTEPCVQ